MSYSVHALIPKLYFIIYQIPEETNTNVTHCFVQLNENPSYISLHYHNKQMPSC